MSENLETTQNTKPSSTFTKAISNPLTIIAGFSMLAEIAMVTALKIVDIQLQPIFIWFVMLFPAFLALGFYLTLNFNSKVLYAPSDFKDESNYMNALGLVKQQATELDKIEKTVETAISQVDDTVKQISGVGEAVNQQLQERLETLNKQLKSIEENVSYAKERNLQARFNIELQGDTPPISSLTRWNTDVIAVPINAQQHARWGDTVNLYARVINLTDREIKLGGSGAGASHIKHGKFLDGKGFDVNTLPPRSISQPRLVLSLHLNPDNFSKITSPITANWAVTVPKNLDSNTEYNSCEPAIWAITILD